MLDMGIVVQVYQSNNGIFASVDFMEEINKGLQNITFSRNGIAECGIQSISTNVRTLLIHASIWWPVATEKSLWLMAVHYALHCHNHLPRATAGMMSLLEVL